METDQNMPTRQPAFEIYTRHPESQPDGQPLITITKGGRFLLNPEAFVSLSSPRKVEMLFDRAARIVGLRSVPTATRHALWVVPRKQEFRNGDADGAPQVYVIEAATYLAHYGIRHGKKRRYTTGKVADVLTIHLDTQSSAPTADDALAQDDMRLPKPRW